MGLISLVFSLIKIVLFLVLFFIMLVLIIPVGIIFLIVSKRLSKRVERRMKKEEKLNKEGKSLYSNEDRIYFFKLQYFYKTIEENKGKKEFLEKLKNNPELKIKISKILKNGQWAIILHSKSLLKKSTNKIETLLIELGIEKELHNIETLVEKKSDYLFLIEFALGNNDIIADETKVQFEKIIKTLKSDEINNDPSVLNWIVKEFEKTVLPYIINKIDIDLSVDYYDVLDIDENAIEKEIKNAYRTQSKRSHPDLGGSQEEFEKVNKAYNVLKNLEKRNIYLKLRKYN